MFAGGAGAGPVPAEASPQSVGATATLPIATANTPAVTTTRSDSASPVAPPSIPRAPTAATQAGAVADTTTMLQSGRSAPAQLSAADSVHVTSTEVSRRELDIFGDSLPARVTDAPAAAAAPSWDMEVQSYESVSRVRHFVQLFSGPAKEHIASRLEKGSRYEPMIRAKMRDGGLPEDMYYLALVESGFDPNAYSKAAAVGMWQFMTSTARDMGMRVDWWIDERRDPVRSTRAAVRFIRGMKEQFGSLYLAAAAYDGGPGRIARGLSRYAGDLEGTSGDDAFFVLADKSYLRKETRDYVPQLIAAALIGKDPHRYGMEVKTQPPFVYDSVRLGPGLPLATVAKVSGCSVAAIRELNPHILRGITPPKDSILVRVPVGSADGFIDRLMVLPRSERIGLRSVRLDKPVHVELLAKREGTGPKDIELFNPKLKRSKKTGRILPGQTILIPSPEVAAAALAVPDPSLELYPGSRFRSVHVVRRGETLSGIALHYHTTVKSLMTLNGLHKPMIFPGQELVVSGRRPSAASGSAAHRHKKKSATG